MAITIDSFDYDGSAAADITTPYLDVSQFSNIRALLFGNANMNVLYRWSGDKGVNTDYIDTVAVTAGITSYESVSIKARYLSITYDITVSPTTIRAYNLFRSTPVSALDLQNVGTGAEIYKDGGKIRTAVSLDGSITVQQLVDEVNVQANGSNITLSSAGGTQTLVADGVGPSLANKGLTAGTGVGLSSDASSVTLSSTLTPVYANDWKIIPTAGGYTFDIGGLGANSISVMRKDSITNIGIRSVHIGDSYPKDRIAANSVGIGYNCGHAYGDYCVCIGSGCDAFNCGQSVFIGGNVSNNGQQDRQVVIGYGSVGSSRYGVNIGADIPSHATTNYMVNIGYGCVPSAVAAGRLSFGANMEAPHNSFPVPAANPQKYLKISWNGVLYYIPAYTTVPS